MLRLRRHLPYVYDLQNYLKIHIFATQMAKNIYYQYNAETDNFERVYPSLRSRLGAGAKYLGVGFVIGVGIFLLFYYGFSSPTEKNLRHENSRLMARYQVLGKRLENSLKVISDLQERDDNFYRVMLQMEPLSKSRRLAGLDKEKRYRDLYKLSDQQLVEQLSRNLDLLERQIYTQILSYDELQEAVESQKEKLAHLPAISPLPSGSYLIASGFGQRHDPEYGLNKFHNGLDLSAPEGTPVISTASGTVTFAGKKENNGYCVEIDHGYNYMTVYSHLKSIEVKEGQQVKRGQSIAEVGNTGRSREPHLHYEVRFRSKPVNPVNYYFLDLSPEQHEQLEHTAENAGRMLD